MPFEKNIKICLTNETGKDLRISCLTEASDLDEWDPELGYFHASWKRFAFQLQGKSDLPFFHIDGRGHYVGCNWSVSSDEPLFDRFRFIMEASHEIRIDDESKPSVEYLGTEEVFGFSWGFQREINGLFNGMNYLRNGVPAILNAYAFRHSNTIPFQESFDLRTNWKEDWKDKTDFQKALSLINEHDRGWVDYATTYYWYQQGIGYEHENLPTLEERVKPILHPNPLEEKLDLGTFSLHEG